MKLFLDVDREGATVTFSDGNIQRLSLGKYAQEDIVDKIKNLCFANNSHLGEWGGSSILAKQLHEIYIDGRGYGEVVKRLLEKEGLKVNNMTYKAYL